eukprot:CAMPEP_0174716916 /NCGR_PEP_ID=MMETSP1094-20130205/25250_1 /TAXON_ID=156173 /ORGANISM="Chrysochromulina brevifilum, Strain UTEX LB 985" /LENGTH=51 /DNA_ID=CAMNT_0015916781 /DNA_START=288 /DNA_END=444 /DNA_ORIENTATION=+
MKHVVPHAPMRYVAWRKLYTEDITSQRPGTCTGKAVIVYAMVCEGGDLALR